MSKTKNVSQRSRAYDSEQRRRIMEPSSPAKRGTRRCRTRGHCKVNSSCQSYVSTDWLQFFLKYLLHFIDPPGIPHITGHDVARTLVAGDHVHLRCMAENGNPPPSLIWYRNGVSVSRNYTYTQGVSQHMFLYPLVQLRCLFLSVYQKRIQLSRSSVG